MQDLAADQNYWYDAEGNVTTDEAKGVRWLAREGANVLPEHREALEQFQSSGKVARQTDTAVAEEAEAEPKAAKPTANKSASPTKNKGAKK